MKTRKIGLRIIRNMELARRSTDMKLLEKYSEWLEKNGYLDTDWREEKPTSIDQFMIEEYKQTGI